MRKSFRHTGVLMMIAVVALGLVGAGYALWYEELTVTTNASTGTFNVDWSLHPVVAGGPNAQAIACLDGGSAVAGSTNPCEKADGSGYKTAAQVQLAGGYGNLDRVNTKMPTCTAAMTDSGAADLESSNDAATGGNSNNLLTLTLGGLYPYAGCQFGFDMSNVGTVPAHIALEQRQTATGPLPANALGFAVVGPDPYGLCYTMGRALTDVTAPIPFTDIRPSGGDYLQLHAGESTLCTIDIWLSERVGEQRDGATGVVVPEGSNVSISAEFIAHQWNEAVTANNHTDTNGN